MGVNRRMDQFQYSLADSMLRYRCKATIGASGAPTVVSTQSEGVASLERSGTGAYTLTLDDKPAQFVDMNVLIENSSEANYLQFHLADETIATDKTIDFVMHQAGTATDPASGDVMWIDLLVRLTDRR
jgi:hypothetical protein